MRSLHLILVVATLSGCELLDAATSDRPNSRQMSALGDSFGSIAAFQAVTDDPATADTGDLADIHATEPYQVMLDPDAPAARRAPVARLPLDGCATRTSPTAVRWECPFTVLGVSCMAIGNGTKNGDGSYSGESVQTCPALSVKVTATNVKYDKAGGTGSGVLTVQVGRPTLAGWATLTITGLKLCLDKPTPLPNAGLVVVDGQGPLDGLPFDPLKIRFSDTPVCGTALIEK